MNAFDNENLKDELCGSCDCKAFNPVVDYAVNGNAAVVSQNSTFDSGDGFNVLRASVYDKNGNGRHAKMDGSGTGATVGTVTIASGAVTGVPVTAAGSGYKSPPSVVLTGGGGSGAVAIAEIDAAGTVTGIVIKDGGSGYTSAPTATLNVTSATINLDGMDKSDLTIKAFINSTGGCKADLAQYRIGSVASSGTLGNINDQGDNVG